MAVYAQDQSSILQALLGGGQKPNTPLPTLTPESLKRMRDQADSMEQAGMDYSPIASPWQGLARVAQGALGGWKEGAANRAEQAATAAADEPLSYWTGGGQSQASAPASSAPTQVSTNATHNGPQKDSAFGTVAPKLMGALQSDYGLSPAQAAGVVGSLGHESGGFNTMQEINPQGGGRGGLGYAQWTGPRRKAFEALLGGRDPSDFGANYDMLKSELGAKGEGPEGRVLAALKNAQTPEEAQRIWTSTFERPGVVADGSRNQWAQRAMALAGQGVPQPAMAQDAPQGVQVASADPNFMPQMPQGGAPVQPPEGGNLRAPIPGPQGGPQAPMQPPQGMQPPAPMQTAQAAPQGAPQGMGGPQGMGAQGGQPFNPMQIIQSDPRAQRAMQMMNSPFATPANKQMAEMYLKQVTQDPAIAQKNALEVQELRGKVDMQPLQQEQLRGQIALQPGQLQEQADKHNQVGKTGDINEYEYGKNDPNFFRRQDEARRAGSQSITIQNGGTNSQVFDTMKEAYGSAGAAVQGLRAINEARKAVDSGIISGAGADARLGLAKIASFFGADPSQVQNTETFRAAIAPQVAATLKATVGTANISNSDREFAEKAAGGSIALDEGSIKRLLGIMEGAQRGQVKMYQERLDNVYPDQPDGQFKRERALFGVNVPDPYTSPVAPQAVQPPGRAAPAAAGGQPQPAIPKSVDEYKALPSGALFQAPDGSIRTKP